MVKKLYYFGTIAVLLVAPLACNKAASPVIPAGSSVLHLTVPSKIQSLLFKSKTGNPTASTTAPLGGEVALEYYLSAEGQAPVTGVLFFADGSQMGNIYLNLPKAGTWLVAAELFSVSNPLIGAKNPSAKLVLPGLVANPEFVGADIVDIQGTTSFTLNMEDIDSGTESGCYNGIITDLTDCDYNLGGVSWQDLFTFDSGASAASTVVGLTTGDILASFDAATNSTYLGSPSGGASFAYLGNGDLVNFPQVPSGAAFYPDTISAKTAVAGAASAAITVNDIFVVKIPSQNAMVWLQVWINNNVCTAGPGGSSLMQFWFVYNKENLDYMKFDQTTYGLFNCNQNPTPTPLP